MTLGFARCYATLRAAALRAIETPRFLAIASTVEGDEDRARHREQLALHRVAHVSEASRTIACATCRKLHDVAYTGEPWKEPADPVPEHPVCPSARTRTHRTTLWRDPGPCPRCGAIMTNEGVTTLWD